MFETLKRKAASYYVMGVAPYSLLLLLRLIEHLDRTTVISVGYSERLLSGATN